MIYLDNAATTHPKPRTVLCEVRRCLTKYGGNPGRGAHPLALAAAEKIYACREALADFLGMDAPERILFTCNTTYALNLALKGILRPKSHVLISELEHNAVLRPLSRLCATRGVHFDTFPVLGLDTQALLDGIRARLTPKTVAVISTHASNICSVSVPLAAIGALCHEYGLYFIVDAAQSAGHLPIDMQAMQISALAAPAHKALYGIQGAGLLALGDGLTLDTLVEGGSGSDSLNKEMPAEPPERYEAGTLPTPAIAALLAGVSFLQEIGMAEIAAREERLFSLARERLESLSHFMIYRPENVGSVLSFCHDSLPPSAIAEHLAARGICVRAGYHCAPLAHRALGTPKGGTVRVSFGAFNTAREVDALYRALREL